MVLVVICVRNQNKIPEKDITSPLQGNTITVESANNVGVSVPGATMHTGAEHCVSIPPAPSYFHIRYQPPPPPVPPSSQIEVAESNYVLSDLEKPHLDYQSKFLRLLRKYI